MQFDPIRWGAHVQLYPNVLRFMPSQRECGVTHTYHEGISSGTRLGEDLDLLAVNETELEESPLECRQGRCARADADNATPHPRGQGREARMARLTAQADWGSYSVHDRSMDENGSHLQCGPSPIDLLHRSSWRGSDAVI